MRHILYTDSSRARFEFVCLRDRTSRVTGNDQSTDSLVEKLSFFPNRYCVGALNSRGHRTGILVIRACNHHFCYLRFRDLVRSRASKEATRCILTTRAAEEKGSAHSRWGHALIDRDSVRTGCSNDDRGRVYDFIWVIRIPPMAGRGRSALHPRRSESDGQPRGI